MLINIRVLQFLNQVAGRLLVSSGLPLKTFLFQLFIKDTYIFVARGLYLVGEKIREKNLTRPGQERVGPVHIFSQLIDHNKEIKIHAQCADSRAFFLGRW